MLLTGRSESYSYVGDWGGRAEDRLAIWKGLLEVYSVCGLSTRPL